MDVGFTKKKQEETLYHDHVCAYTCTNIKVERYPILCRGIFGKGSPVFVVNTGLNFIRSSHLYHTGYFEKLFQGDQHRLFLCIQPRVIKINEKQYAPLLQEWTLVRSV